MTVVLATSTIAESLVLVGAGVLLAGAYTALSALRPYYRRKLRSKEKMEEWGSVLAVFGSLVAFMGVTWDSGAKLNIGWVVLALTAFYVILVASRPYWSSGGSTRRGRGFPKPRRGRRSRHPTARVREQRRSRPTYSTVQGRRRRHRRRSRTRR